MTPEERDKFIEAVRDETVKSLERQLDSCREYTDLLQSKVTNLTARNEELRFALSCIKGKE